MMLPHEITQKQMRQFDDSPFNEYTCYFMYT